MFLVLVLGLAPVPREDIHPLPVDGPTLDCRRARYDDRPRLLQDGHYPYDGWPSREINRSKNECAKEYAKEPRRKCDGEPYPLSAWKVQVKYHRKREYVN